jgi:hypothetical protein
MGPGVVDIDDDVDIVIVVNEGSGRGHSRGEDGGPTFAFGTVALVVGCTRAAMSAVSSRAHSPPLSFLFALDGDKLLVGHPLPLFLAPHGALPVDGPRDAGPATPLIRDLSPKQAAWHHREQSSQAMLNPSS